ncbi:hypothetical protein SELMODRAFT_412929 [Selaginella moellendorffii]|uniref:Oligopeptidase A N-terminal domain-containing protein n=1 Tax=Selaginella moellendorffii TaxID=88036 RepID=D8RMS8_SELML|nr:hypothetical protein SELMODRAFT_412929 [Selaginella moellendorffii]
MVNPLVSVGCLPEFNRVEAHHVVPGVKQVVKELEEDLLELECFAASSFGENGGDLWEALIHPFECILDRLTVVWGIVSHLKDVNDSDALRAAVDEAQPLRTNFLLRLGQSNALYQAFEKIRSGALFDTLNEAQQRVVEGRLKDAILNGVALEHEKKVHFNEIQQSRVIDRNSDRRFLDRAATIVNGEHHGSEKINPWRLRPVSHVEELKLLLRMTPVWATGIPIFVAWWQQSTFWIGQGYVMDLRMGSSPHAFKMQPVTLPVFSLLTMMIFLPFYDKLVVPLAAKVTRNPRGITFLQRIGVGITFAASAMLVAGAVEAFVTIGYLEFFYDQSPPSMRSMAAAAVWAIIGTGNYVSTAIVALIKRSTRISMTENLEYFYWVLAGCLAVDFVAHLLVSTFYTYTKPDYADDGDQVPIAMI